MLAEPVVETTDPADADLQAVTPAEQDHAPQYSRVTPAMASAIVRLKRARPTITQREIAAAIGVRSVATVSYWLRELDTDTVVEARKYVKSNALRAAMKIAEQVEHDDPRVSQGAAKAITALAGVAETGPAVQVGVQVVIGSVGAPAGHDPFETQTVSAVVSKT